MATTGLTTPPQVVPLKIVIIGDGGCGKSALLMAYTDTRFDAKFEPTVLDNYEVLLELGTDKNLKLTVVDTAGQEEFGNIRKLSLPGTDVIMVCYSCTSIDTLNNVKSMWIPEVRSVINDVPFVLVGNKQDMVEPNDDECVTKSAAAKMGKQLKAYISLQCSAKEYSESKGHSGKVKMVFNAAIKCGLIKAGVLPPPPCLSCTLL